MSDILCLMVAKKRSFFCRRFFILIKFLFPCFSKPFAFGLCAAKKGTFCCGREKEKSDEEIFITGRSGVNRF